MRRASKYICDNNNCQICKCWESTLNELKSNALLPHIISFTKVYYCWDSIPEGVCCEPNAVSVKNKK